MKNLPPRHQQIITMHAAFICQVVQLSQNTAARNSLDATLRQAEEAGWQTLVQTVRQILNGQRDMSLIRGLDEEDQVIAEAIMRGLQDPSTLPDPNQKPEPALAAPGLASMIQAAASGNVEALTLTADMAEQMQRAGGPMARLAAVIRPLINGERNPDKLCKGMNEQTRQLVLGIIEALDQERLH
ncbi:hypothetical protein [Sedimenticola selenatireducens]